MLNSKYVAIVSLPSKEEDEIDYDIFEADNCDIRIDGSLLITLRGKQTCLLNAGDWSDVSLAPTSSINCNKPQYNSFLSKNFQGC